MLGCLGLRHALQPSLQQGQDTLAEAHPDYPRHCRLRAAANLHVWYTVDYFSGHPTVSRVSGSYQGSFVGEADTLTLLPNGTFTQRFAAPAGQVYTSTGRWTLSPAGFSMFDFDSSDTVMFDKVIVHLTGNGKQQKPRFSLSGEPWEVENSSLCYSQDGDSEGTCFTR